jgi:hypothetical protein
MRAGLLLATYMKRCSGSGEKATLAAVLPLLHPVLRHNAKRTEK